MPHMRLLPPQISHTYSTSPASQLIVASFLRFFCKSPFILDPDSGDPEVLSYLCFNRMNGTSITCVSSSMRNQETTELELRHYNGFAFVSNVSYISSASKEIIVLCSKNKLFRDRPLALLRHNFLKCQSVSGIREWAVFVYFDGKSLEHKIQFITFRNTYSLERGNASIKRKAWNSPNFCYWPFLIRKWTKRTSGKACTNKWRRKINKPSLRWNSSRIFLWFWIYPFSPNISFF